MATVMVQNRVSIAQSSLPEAVIVQGITTKKQSSNIVMMLTLSSRDSTYSGLYLSNYASLNMTDELTRLPGVGSVSVMGAGSYSMRIWLDPNAMRIRNLTPDMIFQAISTQNTQVSAGYVGQPIAKADNPFQYTLTVKGRLTTPEEFGNIILRTEEGGKILRLKDVARIELGSSSYNVTSKLKGQPSAAIAIYQLPGSNSLEVAKGVRAKMEQLAGNLPEGVVYDVTLDTTQVINASIDEVLVTFLETTALVILVIFLFLQNFRAVIITCIANPKYSSGEAIQAMEELVQEQLGNNFGYEWTSVAYQETKAGSTTMLVFAMALLVAFLVLSAQYESWTSPIAAIMGLPIALLGAILGCFVMGVPVSIYTQIGIILLIALSAKNGILIVEFARDYHKAGNPIRESALEAGHVRLRPILMTSFAFVLGVMPLLFATGAGAGSRLSLGAAVVFGMAVNTIFATMFIPSFYELMQLFQEKVLDKFSRKQK